MAKKAKKKSATAAKRKKAATRRKTGPAGLSELVRAVQIIDVRADELWARRFLPEEEMPENLVLRGVEKAEAEALPERDELRVAVTCGFWAKSGEDEKRSVAEATARFILRYHVPGDLLSALPQDVLQEFGGRNGIYNAWPYWREYLQSVMTRLGIPGIIAPAYRISPRRGAPKHQARPSGKTSD